MIETMPSSNLLQRFIGNYRQRINFDRQLIDMKKADATSIFFPRGGVMNQHLKRKLKTVVYIK